MSDPTPEQMSRLPKWAQECLSLAIRHRDEAKQELDGYIKTRAESNVWIPRGIDAPLRLPTDRVAFGLPRGHLTFSLERQGAVHCNGTYGSARLMVSFGSSNTFDIHIV